jgi:hypothetical protein
LPEGEEVRLGLSPGSEGEPVESGRSTKWSKWIWLNRRISLFYWIKSPNHCYPIANFKLNISTKGFFECITEVPRDLLWTFVSEKIGSVSVSHERTISPKSHNNLLFKH